jgi:hypothetical protein
VKWANQVLACDWALMFYSENFLVPSQALRAHDYELTRGIFY